jgi:hypothetical protein
MTPATIKKINLEISAAAGIVLHSGWWCPTCNCAVDNFCVTNLELHDERRGGCGNTVGVQEPANYFGDANAILAVRPALLVALGKLKPACSPRVEYLNTLRDVVSRHCPKNRSEFPIVSDYDLLDATPEEHCETILRVFGKWDLGVS